MHHDNVGTVRQLSVARQIQEGYTLPCPGEPLATPRLMSTNLHRALEETIQSCVLTSSPGTAPVELRVVEAVCDGSGLEQACFPTSDAREQPQYEYDGWKGVRSYCLISVGACITVTAR